jgi:hypothetical protein
MSSEDREINNYILEVPSFGIYKISKDGNIENGDITLIVEKTCLPGEYSIYDIPSYVVDASTDELNCANLIAKSDIGMTAVQRTAKILAHVASCITSSNVHDKHIISPRVIELFVRPPILRNNPRWRGMRIMSRLEAAKNDVFLNQLYSTLPAEWRIYILLLFGITAPAIYHKMLTFDHVIRMMICKSYFNSSRFAAALTKINDQDILAIEQMTDRQIYNAMVYASFRKIYVCVT